MVYGIKTGSIIVDTSTITVVNDNSLIDNVGSIGVRSQLLAGSAPIKWKRSDEENRIRRGNYALIPIVGKELFWKYTRFFPSQRGSRWMLRELVRKKKSNGRMTKRHRIRAPHKNNYSYTENAKFKRTLKTTKF